MPKFRKKPVVIDAFQWTGELGAAADLAVWVNQLGPAPSFDFRRKFVDDTLGVIIPTLEGEMRAEPGDWIIRGIKGEFYPCKPDIFAATYEPVTPQNAAAVGCLRCGFNACECIDPTKGDRPASWMQSAACQIMAYLRNRVLLRIEPGDIDEPWQESEIETFIAKTIAECAPPAPTPEPKK